MKIFNFKNVKQERALLNKEDAIEVIKTTRKDGHTRITYVFSCSTPECRNTLKVRTSELSKRSRKCMSCVHQKRPYESIYLGLYNDHRRTKVELTYEEFIEFTKIQNCTYCNDTIPWSPYSTVKGEYISRAYFLDRKEFDLPYSISNCVVCCTDCNRIRSNKFSYDEFMQLAPVLKSIRDSRRKVFVENEAQCVGGVCGV